MSFGSKPGPTSNTNTNTSSAQNVNSAPPAWFTNAWQTLLGLGGDLYGGLATPVAGLTTDQQWASYLANGAMQDYTLRPKVPAYDVFGMGSGWDKGMPTVAFAGGTPQVVAAQATPASMTAAQLDPGDISPFMNPFIDEALTPTLDRLRQQQAEVQAGIGGKAAASGMFGGSREAIERMLADRNYRDTLAQTAGNMMLQGWDKASGLASGNTDRAQQAAVLNAQLENAIAALNAQLATGASTSNAQIGAQLGTANAGMQNQMARDYMNLLFQGSQADAQRFLQAVQLQGGLDLQDLQGRLMGAESINKYGVQEQQTAQAALNAYWQQLNNLAKLLGIGDPGKVVNSLTNSTQTGTTTTSKPIDIGSILLGSLLLGAKGF